MPYQYGIVDKRQAKEPSEDGGTIPPSTTSTKVAGGEEPTLKSEEPIPNSKEPTPNSKEPTPNTEESIPDPETPEPPGTPETSEEEAPEVPEVPEAPEAPVTSEVSAQVLPTITEVKSSIMTTTAISTTTIINGEGASNNPDPTNSGSNMLLAALLGTIGLIIILTGLLIIVFWLRRGERAKGVIGNRGLTQLNDDESIDDSINNEMTTYRPRDPDDDHDEQLPSYAEAIVRGRSSALIN